MTDQGIINVLKVVIFNQRELLVDMKKRRDILDKAIPGIEASLEDDIKRLIELERKGGGSNAERLSD